jgi:hypothetical protein
MLTSLASDLATMDKIQAYEAQLSGNNLQQSIPMLISFMTAQPGVQFATPLGNIISARFQDGIIYTIIFDPDSIPAQTTPVTSLDGGDDDSGNGDDDGGGGDAAPSGLMHEHKHRLTLDPIMGGVTATNSVYYMPNGPAYVFSSTYFYQDTTAEQGIAKALTAAGINANYYEATLANFGAIQNASLLYVMDHGGQALLSPIREGTQPQLLTFLATSDQVPQDILQYADGGPLPTVIGDELLELKTNPPQLHISDIGYFAGFTTGAESGHYFSVTSAFFQARAVMQVNGVAYLNSCESYSYDNDMWTAFSPSGQVDQINFLAWDGVVSRTQARETANFVFDRWLGEQNPSVTGAFAGVTSVEIPPERPFDIGSVLSYARTVTKKTEPHTMLTNCAPIEFIQQFPFVIVPPCTYLEGNGEATIGGGMPILNPSIGNAYIIGDGTTPSPSLSINTAMFDANQEFAATISTSPDGAGGQALSNCVIDTLGASVDLGRNEPGTAIQCDAPPGGGYIAISQNGRTSNAFPLTRWPDFTETLSCTYAAPNGGSDVTTVTGSFRG